MNKLKFPKCSVALILREHRWSPYLSPLHSSSCNLKQEEALK